MLLLKNITKTFNQKKNPFEAIKGVSLEVKQGESLAIVGKSGSGKSTLMHMMAGLDTPTTGSIELDGINLAEMSGNELANVRNSKFGFIFQQFFLLPKASVLENTMLPLKIAGIDSKTRKARAIEALKEVDLSDKINNRATDLSGGQKQRVAIARAIVSEPQIIFADEPTGNLDSKTSEQIEDTLFNLNIKKGITLILVTHDIELAKRCGRVIHIVDGKVV